MIRINLGPGIDQSSGRNYLLRDVLILLVVCFLSHKLIEWHSDEFDKQAQDLELKLSELQKSKTTLKKDLEYSKEIRVRSEQVKQRTERVRQLGEGRKVAVVLLDSLQSKHPERMWFTKISYSTKNKNLQLVGYALDHTVIADYMKRLREIGKIDSSELNELKEFVPQQLLRFDFQKDAQIKPKRTEFQTLGLISLKQLVSSEELVKGVTLQKFEINIQISSG